MTDPSAMRFFVTGNVLDIPKPKRIWAECFENGIMVSVLWLVQTLSVSPLQQTSLQPIRLSNETLSDIGQNPRNMVRTKLLFESNQRFIFL